MRALEVQPEDCQAALQLHGVLLALGREEEAHRYGELGLKRAEEALRQHPEWSRPAQLGATVLAGMARREEAEAWIARAMEIDPDENLVLYNAACTWALLGEADHALALLDKWAPKAGIEKKQWIKVDSDFDSLRDDPRFQRLVEQIEESLPAKA